MHHKFLLSLCVNDRYIPRVKFSIARISIMKSVSWN